MINYGILLFLWIVLPGCLSGEAIAQNPAATAYLQWQAAIFSVAVIYYSNLLKFGPFKKLYESRQQIIIGFLWMGVFMFLKQTEISFKETSAINHPMIRFNTVFDIVFVLSYPLITVINTAKIFIQSNIRQNVRMITFRKNSMVILRNNDLKTSQAEKKVYRMRDEEIEA